MITPDIITMSMLFLCMFSLAVQHPCSYQENIYCLAFVCVCFSVLAVPSVGLFVAGSSLRRPGLISGYSVWDLL